MHIEHIAIWTNQLEALKTFYETYFDAYANQKYTNPKTHFESYFLTFADGPRLELMQRPDIEGTHPAEAFVGYSHLAFSAGSREEVDRLTQRLAEDGYQVVGQPRTTGDGYYESVVLDPDGNRVEISV
jgi:lactoylglutathione lyase